jgi:radical SAM-linked protein
MSAKLQRLRVTYARGDPQRYVSHLDMMRFWERALRRAHVPVSYSEGFTPHAQMTLGAPLSVGMTSRGELMEVFLAEGWALERFREAVQEQLPAGVHILTVVEVPAAEPSIQSLLRSADYEYSLRADAPLNAIQERVLAFLGADSFPWEHKREKEIRRYDLRPLVIELRLDVVEPTPVLHARLRAEEGATARPDQVAAALDITNCVERTERAALLLAPTAAGT